LTILCATDQSPSSQAAIDVAAGLARRLGDSLVLLHVVEPYLIGYPEAAGELAMWQRSMHELARTQLETVAGTVRRTGVSTDVRVLSGIAADVILRTASELATRLIVMGTHGRRGPARLFLGSVATRVVRAADRPVLVTREPAATARTARWAGDEPLRLAVGVDGTPASEAALTWTGSLSSHLRKEVTVVRLSWPPQEALRYGLPEAWLGRDPHPAVIEVLEDDLRRQMQALPLLAVDHVRFRTAHVDAAEKLADEARRLEADAIVVGVSKGDLQAWHAVVPTELLRTAGTPVICVPQSTARASKAIPQIRSVLVATDLSDPANRAILPAYGLLRATGGRVELCHVLERANEPERAEALERLRALVPPDAEARSITTSVRVLEDASAANAILAASRRPDVDVVALASHGRSGVKRALLGSVAEEVARRCTRPTLIIQVREP
jgi:nucleotide-binding universal stress UspA family protein